MNDQPRYRNRAHTIGRLVLTTGQQCAGAPILDGVTVRSVDGWTAGGWILRLNPTPGRGPVIAWRGRTGPSHATIRRLTTTPVLRRLFLSRGHLA